MRKFFGLLAIMALAALSAAGMASASSNLADGTTITGTGTNVSLGGVVTCADSVVKTTITNNAPGHGIHGSITAATFTSCGSGNTVTATGLPWTLTTTGTGPTVWTGAVDNATVDVFLSSINTTCRFSGSPSGGNYDNSTEQLTLSGFMSLEPGQSFLCNFSNASVNGVYHVSPTLQLS